MGKRHMRGRFRLRVCESCPSKCEGYMGGRRVFNSGSPREIPKEYKANPDSGLYAYCSAFDPIPGLQNLVFKG
jgi:hypothetical protein